jgi:hypothetical protein
VDAELHDAAAGAHPLQVARGRVGGVDAQGLCVEFEFPAGEEVEPLVAAQRDAVPFGEGDVAGVEDVRLRASL